MNYGEITVGKLVKLVKSHPKEFPNGMDTKIVSGDFEGNSYHEKYEVSRDGSNVFLGFELHEW